VLVEGDRAVGVEYRNTAGQFHAWARGEIVISGGVYGSPQLLQLSGLGPASLCQELALRWCGTCPESARICTTTLTRIWCGAEAAGDGHDLA